MIRDRRRARVRRPRLIAAGALAGLAFSVAWSVPATASTAAPATGSIQVIHGSDLVDGETFTIPDGTNAPTTFEFNSIAGVTSGNVAVPFTSAQSATTVTTTIINTINGIAAGLNVTASSGGLTTVALANDNNGPAGNVSMTENVGNPVFAVSGMSGGVGEAPVLAAIGNKTVNPGAQLQFTVSATDADPGDFLMYSALNLPAGATFDPGTRLFSWTPTSAQVGTYSGVRFQVSDGSLSDFEDITITVPFTPSPTQPQQQSPPLSATQATGQRSAALEKCLNKRTRKARRKCARRALGLPL